MSAPAKPFDEIVALLHAPNLTADAPCPPWCTSGPHPFEATQLCPDEYSRRHAVTVPDTAVLGIEVDGLEFFNTIGFEALAPAINVRDTVDMSELSAPVALQVATDLAKAAEVLAAVTASIAAADAIPTGRHGEIVWPDEDPDQWPTKDRDDEGLEGDR